MREDETSVNYDKRGVCFVVNGTYLWERFGQVK
jgi:hypothetical protein